MGMSRPNWKREAFSSGGRLPNGMNSAVDISEYVRPSVNIRRPDNARPEEEMSEGSVPLE